MPSIVVSANPPDWTAATSTFAGQVVARHEAHRAAAEEPRAVDRALAQQHLR